MIDRSVHLMCAQEDHLANWLCTSLGRAAKSRPQQVAMQSAALWVRNQGWRWGKESRARDVKVRVRARTVLCTWGQVGRSRREEGFRHSLHCPQKPFRLSFHFILPPYQDAGRGFQAHTQVHHPTQRYRLFKIIKSVLHELLSSTQPSFFFSLW